MTQIDDIIGAGRASGPFALCSAEELPERGADRARFDERPAAVERWIAGLPLANLSAAARELRGALEHLAATGLDPAPRLRVLQQLEPSIDYVCGGLRKLYLNVPPPLPSRPRAAAELTLDLREDMARAYQLALVTGDAWRKLGKADRAAALYGTMHHCAATLVESWGLYQAPPPGCWLLLHRSRRHATEARVNQRRLRVGKTTAHIDNLYKQVLLCAAAGPYQMGRGEALDAFNALAQVASRAQLLPANDAQAAQCPFRVDPVVDDGPSPNIGAPGDTAETVLHLHTAGMVEETRKRLRGTGILWWRKTLPEDAARRLHRLTLSLAAVAERREARQPDHKPASLVVGLSHVHRVLDAEDEAYFSSSQFESRDGRSQETALEVHDVWKEIYSGDVLEEIAAQEPEVEEAHWVADYTPESSAAENFWELVNSSPGGFGLIAVDRESSRAQVGDLVMVHTSTGSGAVPNWHIGVIRWLRNENGQGLQLGIEAIGNRPAPVFASAHLGEDRYSEPSRCLLLPEDPERGTPETLIVPTLHYHEGQRTVIRGHERTGDLELLEAVERTALFGRYTFRELDPTGDADDDEAWADI